jgi:UDP-N-acetylglucosamine 2-epimerase (non-hydrolysing)
LKKALKPVVLVVGTRPETIKMMPVYFALKKTNLPIILCSTGQHTTLLEPLFSLFNIRPDYDLQIMQTGQDLFDITIRILEKMKALLHTLMPSLVLVQGDTTTAMTCALAAFYLKIPIGHIEAGLRTTSIWDPYPEEINRRFISQLAHYHFAPTPDSVQNLLAERVKQENIHLTGTKISAKEITITESVVRFVAQAKAMQSPIVLLTTHRRESFSGGIEEILSAIKTCAQKYPHMLFYYPMHPNPTVRKAIADIQLIQQKNIYCVEPILYQDLVYLIDNADLVATDSGGICEEAVSLSKRVLILRNDTERPEALESGLAILTGTEKDKIVRCFEQIIAMQNIKKINTMPFGDGYAADKIANIILSTATT